MNHDYIEQYDLVDRYLRGRLPSEEGEQFEEHLIDCPQCIDRLKTTRDFKQGLRVLMVQQVSNEDDQSAKGLRWLFPERVSWKSLAFAACCLLAVAIIGSTLLAGRVMSLGREAGQAKNTSSEWQRRYEEQQQAILSSEEQRQEKERSLSGHITQLEAELENERKQSAENAGTLQGRMQPGINLPIFPLISVRGNSQNPAAEINEIKLPRSPVNFFMSVSLEGETQYKTYRISILTGRQPFWRRGGYKPDRSNSLTIGFNSSFFRPADYELIVEGVLPDQDSSTIGNYPFRIIKQP
jgi:hypothetical protein